MINISKGTQITDGELTGKGSSKDQFSPFAGIERLDEDKGIAFTPLPGCRRVGKLSGEWALCIKVDGDFRKDLMERPEKFGEYNISCGWQGLDRFADAIRNMEKEFVEKYAAQALKLHCVYVTTTEAPEQVYGMTENQKNPYVPGGHSIEYLAEHDITFLDGTTHKNQLSRRVFYDRKCNAYGAGGYGAQDVAVSLSVLFDERRGLFAAIAAKHEIRMR
jgi:hypothetical protein